jgi:hypothetical protein
MAAVPLILKFGPDRRSSFFNPRSSFLVLFFLCDDDYNCHDD